jgi:imidazole glycerol-phosphate synthase subunit HisH
MNVIIDYGTGNLGSILNMIKKVGGRAIISGNAAEIEQAEKLILPGVGAFDKGMSLLKERNLVELLNYKVLEEKVPILGICLGVQLMTKSSEEGEAEGLKWIDAETVKFNNKKAEKPVKVPHMGWNLVNPRKESRLFHEMHEDPRFYFVHSYHLKCNDDSDILTETHYGYPFVSAIERGNIMGVQFHPEKSHKYGIRLFDNFMNYF